MASIPDDFQIQVDNNTICDITTDGKGDNKKGDNNEDEDSANGLFSRLKFWQRSKHTEEIHAINALELFAQSLREEHYVPKPVVNEVIAQEKGVFQKALNVLYIPRSLVSFASREAF
eukprot:scaffold5051_cov74-Cyclotella_meneghiniana.AAC.1